jgi:hypothetical protein
VSPARRAQVCLRIAVLGCTLAVCAPARAQDPAPPVDVTVVGTAEDLERVRGLVPRLAAGGARWLRVDRMDPGDVLRERRDSDAGGAAVRAWVDLTIPTRARLAFATRSERFLVRDVDLSGRFDEVDRAALGEVLESSIGALVANERAGLTRTEAEAVLARRDVSAPPAVVTAPGPPQPVSVLAPPPSRWAVGFFYAAQALSDEPALDQGPGLTLAVASFPRWPLVHETGRGPIIFASAQYRLPVHERGPRIGVALYTIAARAGVECGPLLWERLRVRLGAGADIVHVAPESSDPAATLSAAHWSSSFVASAALRANLIRQPRRFWLSATLLADVLPTAVRYDVALDGATEPVFSPWRVRPGLTLELTFF